ncbi:MarR family transcriptional regulator [Rhodopseudomonas palustris]|nr:MarR family transcriptional regulator [Rhodopseudomonas palustris]RIA01603.1 MarR family transcriptional regulator [Rhodopseudomonas palustris]
MRTMFAGRCPAVCDNVMLEAPEIRPVRLSSHLLQDEAAFSIMTTTEDAGWLERLSLILDAFREIHPEITANQILVLLQIGGKPGITQRELSDRTGLKDGTISRICALMSERGHQDRAGLSIVDIRGVPGDYRLKGQYLVGRGNDLYARVQSLMTTGG